MAQVMEIVSYLLANWGLLLNALIGVLSALVILFLLIPGKHPEDWFQAAADFLAKFSKK